MNILEALWGGQIRPADRSVQHNSEFDKLRKAAQKDYDHFWALLSPEAKEAYNAYLMKDVELSLISDKDFFIKGFRLGVQMLLAAMGEYSSQLPQNMDGQFV